MDEIIRQVLSNALRVIAKQLVKMNEEAGDSDYPEAHRLEAANNATRLSQLHNGVNAMLAGWDASAEDPELFNETVDQAREDANQDDQELPTAGDWEVPGVRPEKTRQELMVEEARTLAQKYPGTIFMGFDPRKADEVELAAQQINAIKVAQGSGQ